MHIIAYAFIRLASLARLAVSIMSQHDKKRKNVFLQNTNNPHSPQNNRLACNFCDISSKCIF